MEISLRVDVNGMYGRWSVGTVVPELYKEQFRPLKICDDFLVAAVTGDEIATSYKVEVIMKTREDAADILAKELAKLIVGAMQREDTHNGYTKS